MQLTTNHLRRLATNHFVGQITNVINKYSVPVNCTRKLLYDLILPVRSIGLPYNNTVLDEMNS